MIPSKRRKESLPRILLQGIVVAFLLSTTHSQWLSFKSSRNPKSNLWFPNMPAPKTLQQRSSAGTSIRGAETSSSSAHNNNVNSDSSSSNLNINHESRHGQQRSRPIGHRSVPHHVGQPTYQTVHGGMINRQESVSTHNRNNNGYTSSSRLMHSQRDHRQNQQFSHRSGQPQSWMGKSSNSPTVITSKHLSINLNQPQRNKGSSNNWSNTGSSSSNSGSQTPHSYTSSRRLLEVGRVGHIEMPNAPTRRPITQIAGALQDSWPNSNTHHHLSPVMKNQKPNVPNGRNNYYDQNTNGGGGSNWGSQVRVSDPIELKAPKPASTEQRENAMENRKLSVGGREKLVSNTLNTLAKLSPKKPIFVYMRVEGIAAINAGAEAGDVIKKLAGGSKLPFYNGTKSLPKENMPQVFLAPEDMPPPSNYGKIPIPNLRPKEASTPKPTFTKILLPGGTKMTSHLTKTTTTTTTTTPAPQLIQQSQFPFVQSTAQSADYPSFLQMNGTGAFNQPLSLDQRIKILQMFQNQGGNIFPQQAQSLPSMAPSPTMAYFPPSPSPTPLHSDILRGVLPQGAILESITAMGGERQGGDINQFSQYPVHEPSSNSIQHPDPSVQPERNIKDILGSIIETAVSKTVGEMLPAMHQQQQHPARVGQAQSREQMHHPYNPYQQQQQPSPTPFAQHQQVFQQNVAQSQGQMQVQMINGQPMLVPSHWTQQQVEPKMDNNQRPRPTRPPPQNNALKSALSFLGIQSTPRPNGGPSGPTVRPFNFQPTSPSPPMFNGPSVSPMPPTRMPLFHQQRPQYPAARREDSGFAGSVETGVERRPGQTLVVQTPDSSRPNGQKSTFVIANGDKNLPDLKKIMKVLNDLNGEQPHQGQSPSPSGPPTQFLHQSPTRAPLFQQSPSPSSPMPTRRPTMFPFNPTGRPAPPQAPQQPQVMIRHPSGTPTPGPVIVSTGRPAGQPLHQIVSSTFSPHGGPTTPRPVFVSSTAGPMMAGPSPSSSPVQIVKALSHPDFIQFQQSPRPQMATPATVPQNNRPTPQVVFANGNPSNPSNVIMKSIVSAIPGMITNRPANRPAPPIPPKPQPTAVLPPGITGVPAGTAPKIIEVDPNLSPEEQQKSIMDSIMKHQQETHGGLSNGPIVINADPSMANALGNSQHFMKVQQTSDPSSNNSSSFTVQPAFDSEPKPSTRPGSNEVNSSGSGSMEKQGENKNHFHSYSKEHHHSKEVSGEKPSRKYKSGESGEKMRNNNDHSLEEKIIEKVITEEKIVWNPGPSEGEMIPSRIKTEERIILNSHGSKSVEKKTQELVGDSVHSSTEKDIMESSSSERKNMYEKNAFGFKLLNNKEIKNTEESSDKSDDKSFHSSNFAGLLRSKLKFEKMKQKLYSKKNTADQPAENPFSRFLNPSSAPTDATSTVSETTQTVVSTTINSPDPSTTITAQSPEPTPATVDNGRFKIRPGDISSNTNKPFEGIQGPVYGISPTGQPILLQQPTLPTFMASPSPSALPPMPSPPSYGVNPSASPASYIGPSPSSFPFLQASPSAPSYPNVHPTIQSQVKAMAPGTKDEKLFFIPADTQQPNPGQVSPTIQTKNGQNQTVMFTTINNLPDLMTQLSGTKTEVRMIDDLKSFQATLANVRENQVSGPSTPPTPSQTAGRRVDNVYEKPFTWRPNGTAPVPTVDSFRQRFPPGVGANVLHAVSAGFAANDPKPTWTLNNNGQSQPQLIYAMSNGMPVQMGGYQPILIQGTKEPVLAYYGYNWNGANTASTSVKPTDATVPSESPAESKYTSRFRGPITPETTLDSNKPNKNEHKKESTTRDPIDPVSDEIEEMSKHKKSKSSHKNQPEDDQPKNSRRRRPGALKEEEDSESSEDQDASSNKKHSSHNKSPSVTSNVLSKRIDESDEGTEEVSEKPKKPVKVHKDMFVNSGEKTENEPEPTAKLPILLAPSIISRKSVVSKTGSNYNENSPKPTAAAIAAETSKTTQKLTSAVSKLLSTVPPTKPTTADEDKNGEEDLRETQAQLKSLLKKLQQKLNSQDDVYETGDAFYDYYDEVQKVSPTKEATTTTTTKATKKPKNKFEKSKPKKSNKKKSKSKSNKKKNTKNKKSKNKKSKTNNKKTKTTTTTSKPVTVTSTLITTPVLKNHRHPVSSIETFTSSPTRSTTAYAQPYQASSEVPQSGNRENNSNNNGAIPSVESYSQQQSNPSINAPTVSSPNDDSVVAFVYPQGTGDNSKKDLAASKIHHRRRPLWVRRKTMSGSGEGLEPIAQPSEHAGKVIRLVRRKRPGMRRRPVFVQQSVEVDPDSGHQSTEPTIASTSSTTTMPVDILFENTNEIAKRVGYPDSAERQEPATPRAAGKRKLKLIRLKGQRAQWRLKMNEDQERGDDAVDSPQAERLVSPLDPNQQLPLVSPLPEVEAEARQSRQEPSSSSSIETKVCIRGKCEIVTKQ